MATKNSREDSIKTTHHCYTWDIFCTVIDNFGDIGVAWRLARQLQRQYGQSVRLWVDNIPALAKLLALPLYPPAQYDGVTVCHWDAQFPAHISVADVVIETFACELPQCYQQAMVKRPVPPIWFQLEYLSAETWIEDWHRLSSPHPQLGLSKIVYFPGFTARSGGLIAEHNVVQRARQWQTHHPDDPTSVSISLFTYENPIIGELLDLWKKSERPVICQVPQGQIVKDIATALGHSLVVGKHYTTGSLTVQILPFTSQTHYDTLLWSSQFNFVRGEDSFVRAQWACRPFLWHIYPQTQKHHLIKLNAFLSRYCDKLAPNAAAAVIAAHHAWNNKHSMAQAWQALEPHLATLSVHAYHWPDALLQHGELGYQLVQLVESQIQ